jgi:adenylate cyclase
MRGTTNPEAFRVYLEGERLFSVVARESMEQSRHRFRHASELDPKFARAWGWRSYCHVRSVLRGWLPEAELAHAGQWAERAVELDPLDYATHWDLGFHRLNTRRFEEAKRSYEQGINLYDNGTDFLDRKPGLLAEAAEAYLHSGDAATAIALLERAMRIPDWYRWNLGWAYYQAKRYDEALGMLLSMRSRPGDRAYVPETALFIAAAYYRKAMALNSEGHMDMAATHMDLANDEIRRFKVEHPNFRLEDAVAHRSRFQNKDDEDHWAEALRILWER